MRQDKKRQALVESIVKRLGRAHSTAMVLFHHAVAERLRLGPSDHKCLDLLRDREAMTGSELAAVTGLTTGAVTGVVARLEKAGYLRREPDPQDRRRQILRAVPEGLAEVHRIVEPFRGDTAGLLDRFDAGQLAAIAEFLAGSTEIAFRHASLLRGESVASRFGSASSVAGGGA